MKINYKFIEKQRNWKLFLMLLFLVVDLKYLYVIKIIKNNFIYWFDTMYEDI